jgi:glycine/D-amino acid oxidase-like deaminating enzyme
MSILKSEEYKPSGLPCPNSSASFWHSEPNVALLGHRTTPNLPSAVDVVIVGSGITGASIARYFAEDDRASNLSIIMLEAREACWGATGRNGGHCQPLLTERPPNVGQFEVKNLEAVQSYIEKHNVECEFRLGSACRAFFSKELYEEGLKELQMLERRAPELRKLVRLVTDKDELAKHRISPKAYGATITQGAAQLWPYKFCAAIMQRLVGEGKLNLQTNTPVLSLESQSKTSDAAAVPYVLVRTPRGTIKAKHVILATNGYTSHLLPGFSSLIVPTRCEMSALQPPANSERLPNSYGFVGKTVAGKFRIFAPC